MHRNTITIRDPQHLLEENARLLIFIRTEVATKVGEGWMWKQRYRNDSLVRATIFV